MTTGALAAERKGVLSAGARMVWRRQEVLWWVFAVNLGLGALGTLQAARTLNAALGYSLAGNQLFKGFDLGMVVELIRLPDTNFLNSRSSALACALLFAVFMLFVSGGILEVFREDRRLNTGDFFAASGAFFWRFVRLTLFMLIPFVFLRYAFRELRNWAEYLGDKVSADAIEFLILGAGVIVLALLALTVRVCFDIAKVRTVAENESGMWRSAWASGEITLRHLGTLLWIYVRISLVGAIALLVAFLIWVKLPPTAVPATLILLELVILSQLAARLWQMASATAWYRQYAESMVAAPAYAIPQQPEVPEPEPQLSLYPETELPPADA